MRNRDLSVCDLNKKTHYSEMVNCKGFIFLFSKFNFLGVTLSLTLHNYNKSSDKPKLVTTYFVHMS